MHFMGWSAVLSPAKRHVVDSVAAAAAAAAAAVDGAAPEPGGASPEGPSFPAHSPGPLGEGKGQGAVTVRVVEDDELG